MTLDKLIKAATALREEYGGDHRVGVSVLGREGFTSLNVQATAPPVVFWDARKGAYVEVLILAVVKDG